MGNIIHIEYWPTALRDRRHFYLGESPLIMTALPITVKHDLCMAVCLSATPHRALVYVDDIDFLWRSAHGEVFGGPLGHRLNKILKVWYSDWPFFGRH